MTDTRILVVDDDPKVRALLRRCLETDGHRVDEAAGWADIETVFATEPPDLVTLDLNLGRENGLDLARDIRRKHAVPIIMVTSKDDVIDRVVGLELGADDYITKPFHIREVQARVRSVLRRTAQATRAATDQPHAPETSELQEMDELKIDINRMTLTDRDGQPCDLTTADFKLLLAFLRNPKRPLSRDRLMDLIEGPEWAPLDRTIDNQVARLRKKIERDPSNPKLIKTVRGVGYMLTESAVPVG